MSEEQKEDQVKVISRADLLEKYINSESQSLPLSSEIIIDEAII